MRNTKLLNSRSAVHAAGGFVDLPIQVRLAKRTMDMAGSAAWLVLLSPLLVLIAIGIKIDSPGPILFSRRLIGYHGKPFTAYKFRTMVADAHNLLVSSPELLGEYRANLKIVNDPRVTRLGRVLRKLSLDELPQLVTVLKGDMSLVGPRMLGDIELERYGVWRDKVLSFKPGVTGLWQVNGRHTVSFERRMELDLQYVHNWSLWLDLRILLKTIPVVLTARGAAYH